MKEIMFFIKEIIELKKDLIDGQIDYYSVLVEQGFIYICNSLEIIYE